MEDGQTEPLNYIRPTDAKIYRKLGSELSLSTPVSRSEENRIEICWTEIFPALFGS